MKWYENVVQTLKLFLIGDKQFRGKNNQLGGSKSLSELGGHVAAIIIKIKARALAVIFLALFIFANSAPFYRNLLLDEEVIFGRHSKLIHTELK